MTVPGLEEDHRSELSQTTGLERLLLMRIQSGGVNEETGV